MIPTPGAVILPSHPGIIYSLASREIRHHALHAWWAWMVRGNTLDSSIVALVQRSGVPKECLSEADLQALFDACDADAMTGCRRLAMLRLLATTGMRQNELTHLQVMDLDWEEEQILVRFAKGQKSRFVPFLGKTQEGVGRYFGLRHDSEEAHGGTVQSAPHEV